MIDRRRIDCGATIRGMTNLDGVVKELQEERDRLDQAIAILNSLNGNPRQRVVTATRRPKRRISPAGIARIRAAAKARWAKVRAEQKKKK